MTEDAIRDLAAKIIVDGKDLAEDSVKYRYLTYADDGFSQYAAVISDNGSHKILIIQEDKYKENNIDVIEQWTFVFNSDGSMDTTHDLIYKYESAEVKTDQPKDKAMEVVCKIIQRFTGHPLFPAA